MSQKILPTKWPLFEFHFSIWRLHIKTALFVPEKEIRVYEYLMLVVYWNAKQIFRFRLFDIYERMIERAYKVDLDQKVFKKAEENAKPVEKPAEETPGTSEKSKINSGGRTIN